MIWWSELCHEFIWMIMGEECVWKQGGALRAWNHGWIKFTWSSWGAVRILIYASNIPYFYCRYTCWNKAIRDRSIIGSICFLKMVKSALSAPEFSTRISQLKLHDIWLFAITFTAPYYSWGVRKKNIYRYISININIYSSFFIQ